MNLNLGYLYGDLMNIYGDTGNIITLQKRAEWRGIKVQVKQVSLKDKIKPKEFDLFFFGGGQDQAQKSVSEDFQKSGKGEIVKQEAERGVPTLSICGGYQLMSEYYQPHQGAKLLGNGLFPAYTKASHDRMIGNVVIEVTPDPDKDLPHQIVVGFENHSGKTYLKPKAKPFGYIIKGFGNNGSDKTEGCIYKNSIGCYLHGSLLPKNPQLADWFIKKALEVKYNQDIQLKPLKDETENKAHQSAIIKFS